MNTNLADKTVVVSGAAGGVGRSIVAKMLAEGAKVLATDISDNVAELEKQSDAVVAIVGDVTKSSDVEAIFAKAEEFKYSTFCWISIKSQEVKIPLFIWIRT